MPHIPEILLIPFVCSILLSVVLSLYSVFVVVNRWAFLSVGVSHAAFGGVALGYLLGVSPEVSALIFALVAGFMIALMKRRGGFSEDVSTGVIFSTFMALGVVLFSLSERYMGDVFSYLFGNMLSVDSKDLLVSSVLFTISVAFFLLNRRALFLSIVDEELAHTCGVNTEFIYYSLVFITTVGVVLSIKLLGVILVSSLTVIPASVGFFFFHKLRHIIATSIVSGILIVITGMAISYYTDMPPGATTALVGGACFFLALILKRTENAQ